MTHLTRRAFCGALTVVPACALGAGCSSSPAAPTPAAPIVTAPPVAAPPVAPPPGMAPEPAVPHGPSGLLPVLDGGGGAGGLSVVIEGTPLASLGGVARAEGTFNGLRHFVLLTRSTADVVAAINGICTHEGCIVTRFEAPAFECPCHGSRYDWSGTVLRGPAPAALPRLQTAFDGRVVRISV